ncbi:MAG: peptide-methionine (S)-S-oxide reductase MsrA [Candidatus Methanomethylicia archaeon]|nr:peptide-methionine (S)-S-oxide reductase MsrA [Candidatus Methanomethylicia archaeon]
MLEIATFGMGCFWGAESIFMGIKGVKKTSVGYMGGHTKNPTYEEVCTDKTGHAEVVQIEYDPNEVTYEELLNAFWENHDPTTPNRQGPDYGTQYRSVIFYHNDEQKKKAEEVLKRLESSKKYKGRIVTEIVPASEFYRAEEYHQKYFEKKRIRTRLFW